MQRLKKILAVALCCVVLCFDAGSSYVYAADVTPAYTKGKLAWDGVAWALLSALGIATGEATGAVDYLTENVWTPLVAHLKEKWGSMCDVFIDKTNNKSYVSKDMMQDTLDWGIENKLWNTAGEEPSLQPSLETQMHHFYDTEKFINFLDGKYTYNYNGTLYSFDSKDFLNNVNKTFLGYNFTIVRFYNHWQPEVFIYNIQVPEGGYVILKRGTFDYITAFVYNENNNVIQTSAYQIEYNLVSKTFKYSGIVCGKNGLTTSESNTNYISANMGTGEGSPAKDYAIDAGLTVPKAGEKIDDWLAAQDKVNGGSVGLLGNDVAIPSDVTGTGAAIDSLPLTIPSFADLVINGQLSTDDVLSQGLVKANTGAIADTQSAAGAVAGAEDVAATGENAEANAISVDQAQTALKNLMQQGIDYIAIEIPNNFWNKIPFSIPYDIYLLIHGIFVGSSGGSKKAPRREASNGSNMPVGDPSNVGIEIDIPTVPLKYTEEKTEDTPPNFTFTLNIPYTTPSGQTANFNKEFTIETAKYNYFAKIIKFSIGLLWLSSVFQWLLAIFSKG